MNAIQQHMGSYWYWLFDMQQFFEWEFKVLPTYGFRLARKSICVGNATTILSILTLSIIYQFVRGMPVLYVETRLRKELDDIKAKEKQMDEEEKEQQLGEEFMHCKQLLQERSNNIVRRLGRKRKWFLDSVQYYYNNPQICF